MRHFCINFVVFLLISSFPLHIFGSIVYSNGFSAPVGDEWSNTKRTTAPHGQVFLGDFGNDSTILSLDNLPSHTSLNLSLNLNILLSMDGNWGDFITISVVGGPVLMNSTFTNPLNLTSGPNQSYPDDYPAVHPPRTGAVAINSLGYNTVSNGYLNPVFGDSTYLLNFSFEHSSPSVQLNFVGSGMGGDPRFPMFPKLTDEAWGIDNVVVTTIDTEIPEPITILIFGSLLLLHKK